MQLLSIVTILASQCSITWLSAACHGRHAARNARGCDTRILSGLVPTNHMSEHVPECLLGKNDCLCAPLPRFSISTVLPACSVDRLKRPRSTPCSPYFAARIAWWKAEHHNSPTCHPPADASHVFLVDWKLTGGCCSDSRSSGRAACTHLYTIQCGRLLTTEYLACFNQ